MADVRVPLTLDDIDDLIYSARVGDLDALKEDITRLSSTHAVTPADIIVAAVDREPESEGGTGACLLHYPAANGNMDIVTYLLTTLNANSATTPSPHLAKLIDLRNYSGNTPLHWAALNTQVECVKALAMAGADIAAKNQDGHDAAFLAERTEWDAAREGENAGSREDKKGKETGDEEVEVEVGGEGQEGQKDKPLPPLSRAMQVVHFLLDLDNERSGSGDAKAEGRGQGQGEASGSGSGSGSESRQEDAMEGVEKTA